MSLESRIVAVVQAVAADIKVIYTALTGKQSTLVSGTNIKTVNGSSLLGSGDLVIGSFIDGGRADETYPTGTRVIDGGNANG